MYYTRHTRALRARLVSPLPQKQLAICLDIINNQLLFNVCGSLISHRPHIGLIEL